MGQVLKLFDIPDHFFSGVARDELHATLPHVYDMLNQACIDRANGKYDVEDVISKLYEGKAQLWVYVNRSKVEACTITEIVVYPKKNILSIWIGTGQNRKNWQGFESVISDWAKETGLDGMETVARIGWTKAFNILGYKHTHNFLEKAF